MAEANEPKKASAPVDRARAAASAEQAPPALDRFTAALVRAVLEPFAELGRLTKMLFETLFWAVRPPYRLRLLVDSMEFVGVGSVFIITLTGFFVGAVLGLQLAEGFRRFNAESQTGALVGIALTREIGPVFAALMVASRAGSAMTAQLGSMRVTNQIDALVTMAVNPVQYLVVPRVLAGLVMVPLLELLFVVVGMFGAWLVCVHLLGIDGGVFLERMRRMVEWPDVRQGLVKAAVFGTTVCLISCRHGFHASGGAAGVGEATNRAVVHCAIAILVLDYVITSMIIGRGLF